MRLFKKFARKKAPRHKFDQRLVFRFRDLSGAAYYSWPDDTAVSIERLSVLEEYSFLLAIGLSKNHYNEYLDALEAADLDARTSKKPSGKVLAIIHDMRERQGKITTVDVYYNYLALFYFREDEKVTGFSQQIQDEKATAFKAAAQKSNSFFFQLPELKKLLGHTAFISGKWQELEAVSQALESNHQRKMKYFSGKESGR